MSEMVMKMPDNLAELLVALKDADENTYLISGGTDLIIKLRKNKIYSGTIIDLKGVEGFNYIKEDNGYIKIGAGTTFTEIADSEFVQKHAACLVQGASRVGSTQIRNAATIGGNVANAFAGADTISPLMAMGAEVKVINSNGETYTKSVDGIVIGSGKNSLKLDEVIIEIIIPILEKKYRSAFAKLGSRSRVTISKLNIAAVVKIDSSSETIEEARIALGSLGKKAFHSSVAEDTIIGKKVSKELKDAFANALTEQVDLAIAGRGSQPYKREAIKGLADEIYGKLFKEVGGELSGKEF